MNDVGEILLMKREIISMRFEILSMEYEILYRKRCEMVAEIIKNHLATRFGKRAYQERYQILLNNIQCQLL